MCEQSVWFPLGPLKCWMKRVVEIYHGYMDGILLETSHNLDGWNIPWMVKESSRDVFPTPGWSPEVFTYYSADGGRIISDVVSMVQLVCNLMQCILPIIMISVVFSLSNVHLFHDSSTNSCSSHNVHLLNIEYYNHVHINVHLLMYKFCSIYSNSFAGYRVPGTKSPWRLLVAGQWAETKANAWSNSGAQVPPIFRALRIRKHRGRMGNVCECHGF